MSFPFSEDRYRSRIPLSSHAAAGGRPRRRGPSSLVVLPDVVLVVPGTFRDLVSFGETSVE